MVFKNKSQLQSFLSKKCANAVAEAERKIYEELAGNLNQFYVEFHPEEYIRTGALFNSLESTGVRKSSNKYISSATAEVGFDTPRYKHGWVPLQSGAYGYSTWSDEKILDVVMTSGLPHGGYEDGTPIWKETMQKLGGRNGIKALLKQELKRQGL